MNSHARDIPALTGRFIAAFVVLITHVALVLPLGLLPRLLAGFAPAGMTLFFALSGFVMWLNYAHPISGKERRALRNFFRARFVRLYPMYLVVIVFALGMICVLHGAPLVQQTLPVNRLPNLIHDWSAPPRVDRCEAVQLAIRRACSSSNLTGLLYPSAE
jgi:peptidoglycan/LPS O-acetylase OafA/YrhL